RDQRAGDGLGGRAAVVGRRLARPVPRVDRAGSVRRGAPDRGAIAGDAAAVRPRAAATLPARAAADRRRFVRLRAREPSGAGPRQPPSRLPRMIDYARRHLRFGWWTLLVYAALGLALEALHGFKVAASLDVDNDTRRLMWRLAHTHGTLLAAINTLFALTLPPPAAPLRNASAISALLIGST